MIPHDVCYSVENIGYNTIKTDPASFCADSLNGVYDEASGTCMEIPFPGNMTTAAAKSWLAGRQLKQRISSEWKVMYIGT